jgi:hypothetical protein
MHTRFVKTFALVAACATNTSSPAAEITRRPQSRARDPPIHHWITAIDTSGTAMVSATPSVSFRIPTVRHALGLGVLRMQRE